MTMLTEAEIRAAKCVQNPVAGSFRATSYDLQINAIIDENGNRHDHICLAPGEMASVVSEEILELAGNVTGVAHYMTRLTRKGVWSQTIGLVDPYWKGPLSTTIVNQSKSNQSLRKGDRYIRVSFFKHAQTPDAYDAKQYSHSEYVREVETAAASYMPNSFLNTKKISADAAAQVFQQMRNSMLAWIGIAAGLFALVTFFAPFATNAASKVYWESFASAQNADLAKRQLEADARNAEQTRLVQQLQQQLLALEIKFSTSPKTQTVKEQAPSQSK